MSNSITKRERALEIATRAKSFGFRVYLSGSGEYGFITDKMGSRVLTFQDGGNSVGGSYWPPSRESGTGWKIEASSEGLSSAAGIHALLYSPAPFWTGKGWKRYATEKDYLSLYGKSSGFVEL